MQNLFYKSRQLHLQLTIKIFISILLEKSNKHNSSQTILSLNLKQWVKNNPEIILPIFILLNVGINISGPKNAFNKLHYIIYY